MPPAFSTNSGRANLDCWRPHEIPRFIVWASAHPDKSSQLRTIVIGTDVYERYALPNRRYLSPPLGTVSLCSLHTILQYTPNLQHLKVHGVRITQCDIDSHTREEDHIPLPSGISLQTLSLLHVGAVYPFAVDGLNLVALGPALKRLDVSACHALSDDESLPPNISPVPKPHASLLPVVPLTASLSALKIAFPDKYSLYAYGMAPDWYDFTLRLPSNRGTATLVLSNVSDLCSGTVCRLLAEDAATLEVLYLDFEPYHQLCSRNAWVDLSFEACIRLTAVTFSLPVFYMPLPGKQRQFMAVYNMVRRLPKTLQTLKFELDLKEAVVRDQVRSIGSVPWGRLDHYLTEVESEAQLVIELRGECVEEHAKVIATNFYCALQQTVVRGRLTLLPERAFSGPVHTVL